MTWSSFDCASAAAALALDEAVAWALAASAEAAVVGTAGAEIAGAAPVEFAAGAAGAAGAEGAAGGELTSSFFSHPRARAAQTTAAQMQDLFLMIPFLPSVVGMAPKRE